MAPELARSAAYAAPPVDVWAFGCLVYEALHARPCFRGDSMEQLQLRIKKARPAPARTPGAG